MSRGVDKLASQYTDSGSFRMLLCRLAENRCLAGHQRGERRDQNLPIEFRGERRKVRKSQNRCFWRRNPPGFRFQLTIDGVNQFDHAYRNIAIAWSPLPFSPISSMSTSNLASGEAQTLVNFRLGPWIIGCCLDLVLQGALFTQFANYFAWYPDDKGIQKAIVAGLFVMTTLKSIQSFVIIWNHAILFFGDLRGAILLNFTAWFELGNPLMVAAIGLYVQLYFCYRLYVISGRSYIVAPVATIFIFAVVAMIFATYFIATQQVSRIADWFTAHLSAVFAGDVLLSCATAFFLLKSRRGALPQSVGLISALVRLTFQTAAPAAICAMLNLISAVRFTGGQGLFALVFNMPLPKLYAISMMFTLNARRNIRAGATLSGGQYSSSDGRLVSRSRPPVQGDVELGPVQFYTNAQTGKDFDVGATLARGPNVGRFDTKGAGLYGMEF
ncbi:hypothetical protein C8R47DRAFT_1162302 [Mycena vitilis]|nr:hypothetical protein C8R47DRAFT_1162302 [Mycena vitilis]